MLLKQNIIKIGKYIFGSRLRKRVTVNISLCLLVNFWVLIKTAGF